MVALFLVGFVAPLSELLRVHKQLGEVSRHAFHDHADVRGFMIQTALADAALPIVVIGDSVT
jgi:hypothetical protein